MSQSKIYVGNLSYDTKEDALESFFSQYGQISETKLITDRDTGRSKGFAFLTFDNQQDAEASLEANDTELEGRKMRVNIAKEPNNRGGGRSNNRGGRHFSNSNRY